MKNGALKAFVYNIYNGGNVWKRKKERRKRREWQ